LPQLFALAKSTFAGLPGWSDERVLEVLDHDVIFVARAKGRLAGYVALRLDETGAILAEQLFVAPGHERRGIGHKLLAHAEGYAIAERARSLRIVVEETNQRAPSSRVRTENVSRVSRTRTGEGDAEAEHARLPYFGEARSQDRVPDLACTQPLFDHAFRVLERRARPELLERDVNDRVTPASRAASTRFG
jgi:GNAT superfamily N-acetyltransferase